MHELDIDEMKQIELGILKYVKKVCEDNNLVYYLAYGTLIGAVRHHGFIPWDDDIDIQMPRSDYKKFSEIVRQDVDSPYKLLYFETDGRYSLPLAKIVDGRTSLHQTFQREMMPLGVYTDIFILDNVPNSAMKRAIQGWELDTLQKVWSASQNKNSNNSRAVTQQLKRLIRRCLCCIGPRRFAERLDRIGQRYDKTTTSSVANLTWSTNRKKDTVRKTMFGEQPTFLLFEGIQFQVPEQYDEYLTHFFGDYMKLPPVEDQQPHHVVKAYLK